MVARGACMVAPGGRHAWLLRGACVVALGGCALFSEGVCMVFSMRYSQ